MNLALRVYKNHEKHKIVGYKIVDDETLQACDIDNRTLKQLIKYNNFTVTNLELTENNQLRLINMNPSVRQKWYSRIMDGDIMTENYCIVLPMRKGLLKFIAIDNNGKIIKGENVTISSVVTALKTPVDKLKFYNAYISYDEIGKTVINIFNNITGKYVSITERDIECNTRKNILGDAWDAKILDVTLNGLRVSTLKNVKLENKAVLPDQICYLGRFKGGVNNLIIESSLNAVGNGCFKGLKDLYNAVIKDGLTEITDECFALSGLEKIKIPNSVQVIGNQAFYKCTRLTGPIVTMATHIMHNAFDSTRISIVNLGGALVICSYAFANNKKLKIVKLEEGLRVIEKYAFYNCPSLENIVIPSTVESIGEHAFDMCPKLNTIKIKIGGQLKIAKKCFKSSVKVEYIQ